MSTVTVAPKELIERLRALQGLDQRIAQLEREIRDGPRAVETYERAVAAADAKVAAVEDRIKVLKAQVKLRENEMKVAEGKVDRLNDQARAVKTNREFITIRSEISSARADVSKLEEEILKIMEAAEQEEKSLVVRRDERAGEQRRLDGERAKVEAGIGALRTSLAALLVDRPPLLGGLPPETLAVYERVQKVRGNAVVPIEQDYCSGCMERLTRNDVLAIHNGSRLVQCKACNRILFVDAL